MTKTLDNKSIFKNPLQPKWDEISWKVVDKLVRRLRFRIFRATRNKDYKSLRSLQRLTGSSLAVCLQATRRVTVISRGRGTPGLDQSVFLSKERRLQIALHVHQMDFNEWQPSRVKRVYIPKPDGRKRPLGIPTITDRIIQAVIATALEPEWEALFESCSYGFRPGKSYQDATHRVFTLLSKKDRVWVVDADITGCFDNIDHSYIMDRVKTFPYSYLVERWLKAGYVDNGVSHETEMGTPQGGVISPLLSNIALHGLEQELNIVYNSQGYVTKRDNPLNRTLIRYADDFIVLCPSEATAQLTLEELNVHLSKRGLKLNPQKTKIVNTFDGFDFIGFNFRHVKKLGYEYVNIGNCSYGIDPYYHKFVSTLVIPSKKSLKSFRSRLSIAFAKARGKETASLIKTVNKMIRGYCESKRTWSFSQAAASIDNHLYKLQMRWIKRRHPKKSTDWVVKRYFRHLQTANINSKWTFHDENSKLICIKCRWYGTRKNWPPVVSSYSPDDPTSVIKEYWKDRQASLFSAKCVDLISGFDYSLASSQKHLCPVCEEFLYNKEPLQRHHIKPISEGGKNTLSNLVLLHSHCHDHVHYGGEFDDWSTTLRIYKSCISTPKIDFEPPDDVEDSIVSKSHVGLCPFQIFIFYLAQLFIF